MKILNQDTLVPISILIALSGAIPFIGSVYAEIKTSSNKIQTLQERQDRIGLATGKLLEDVAAVRAIVERIEKRGDP